MTAQPGVGSTQVVSFVLSAWVTSAQSSAWKAPSMSAWQSRGKSPGNCEFTLAFFCLRELSRGTKQVSGDATATATATAKATVKVRPATVEIFNGNGRNNQRQRYKYSTATVEALMRRRRCTFSSDGQSNGAPSPPALLQHLPGNG